MTYSEKLKDPRWQKKRLEIMELDGWQCRQCGRDDKTLHTHHIFYVRGRQPWEYPNQAFICLCDDCHSKAVTFPSFNQSQVDLIQSLLNQDQNGEIHQLIIAVSLTLQNGIERGSMTKQPDQIQ